MKGDKKIIWIAGLVLFQFLQYAATECFAQADSYDLGRQMQIMDRGITNYENGNYKEADEAFRYVLENVKVLPAEICFYFGANSYHLGKYKQSINWLNKYIELKGTTGQYFEECSNYLKLSEDKYLASTSKEKDVVFETKSEIDYTVMPEIDCGASGRVVCPVCKGQTVVIRRSAMALEYRSCQYCDTHGTLSCQEYNELLMGKLKPKNERVMQ